MKLHLSSKNKMLGGVCAGIAETIGVHMALVIIYIAMWALLPRE